MIAPEEEKIFLDTAETCTKESSSSYSESDLKKQDSEVRKKILLVVSIWIRKLKIVLLKKCMLPPWEAIFFGLQPEDAQMKVL